jgi:hypothetical protein
MLPAEGVQGPVNYQPDQLLADGDAAGTSLSPGHPGADVHVPDGLAGGTFECKGENVGWIVVALVRGVEPAHRLASEECDRHQSFPPLGTQNLPNHTPDQRARKRKSTAVHHDFTHSRPIETRA